MGRDEMQRMMKQLKAASLGLALGFPLVGLAYAETEKPSLTLEFNALEKSETGCRFTFLITNDFPGTLTRAAFEMALFKPDGVVERLTVLDFKDLPAGKTKVTRFNLPNVDCEKIGRILVNELTDCEGDNVDAAICRAALKVQSKATNVQFGL